MKRVVVVLRDEKGKESVYATEPMDDARAESERDRIEQEHAGAGDQNRWIRVGETSVQSKHLVVIRVEEPPSASFFFGGEESEPRFRRDMQF